MFGFNVKYKIISGLVLSGISSMVMGETISLSCGAVGSEREVCREGAKAWEEKTGHTVNIVSTPNDTNEQLALFQQLLANKASDVDVFQVDVVWPGILGSHFIDLKPFTNGIEKEHFDSIVQNNTVEGELKAMPWFTDAGLLYYRKDLLEKYGFEAPKTWDELAETARAVMKAEQQDGNNKMQGFVFQGKAYEGLTCNALEWISSFGGGTIVDAQGNVSVNNAQAIEALDKVASWIGDIAPQGVLNYAEEEARGTFQSGYAVFMRSWPYAWALANSSESPIKGKVGVSVLPSNEPTMVGSATLGGWQLAVSKYSNHPEIAADLVMFLTSKEEQKRRAIVGGYNPTYPELYEDAEILAANPFFAELYDTFTNAVARPSDVTKGKYNRVSNAFWEATHSVLAGNSDAATALNALETQLNAIKKRGW
ncbi:ABC transporter substrate-binding protein [Rappaport israeli]|uniref:ABC transporter substrate-binding protein n=1 Tax=Rappaport israeli TaxID=1839807 RepID=UPI00092FE09F|nr:ABC transporter substrate-binding protein [Rappaport israeli]